MVCPPLGHLRLNGPPDRHLFRRFEPLAKFILVVFALNKGGDIHNADIDVFPTENVGGGAGSPSPHLTNGYAGVLNATDRFQ